MAHRMCAADPLCWHGATRARVANEYLLATEAGLKEMPSYTFPFIVFHGADDTLTDPDGSRTLYERSQVRKSLCACHSHAVLLICSVLLYSGSLAAHFHDALKAFRDGGGAVQTKDKTFRLIEKRWHVLLKEPGNAEILQEVIAWLKART